MGSSPRGFSGFGNLEFGGAGAPHKSSGAFGSLLDSPKFSAGFVWVGGVGDVRQNDSGRLSQKVWGHSFQTSVSLSMDGLPVVRDLFHLSAWSSFQETAM